MPNCNVAELDIVIPNSRDELMEMRRQLTAMKEIFDRLQIVNSKLMKKVMSGKVLFLNRIVMWEMICLPVVVILILANCSFYDATLWLAWSFFIFGAIDILVDIKTVRIPVKFITQLPLLELREKLEQRKRLRRIQTAVGLPLVVVWALWAYAEWFKPLDYVGAIRNGDPAVWLLIFLLMVLLVFAVLLALWIVRKIDCTDDSLIKDIDVTE